LPQVAGLSLLAEVLPKKACRSASGHAHFGRFEEYESRENQRQARKFDLSAA
jgi:hypothetical protein